MTRFDQLLEEAFNAGWWECNTHFQNYELAYGIQLPSESDRDRAFRSWREALAAPKGDKWPGYPDEAAELKGYLGDKMRYLRREDVLFE